MSPVFRFWIRTAALRSGALLGACLVLAGCTGDGSGLPTPEEECLMPQGSLAFPPRLSCIQTRIFDPTCTGAACHSSPSPRVGLNLDAGMSHRSLVNIPSQEQPALLRVGPRNPDISYLVRKIEGGPAISGAQMPLQKPALSAAEILVVRAWIEAGALDD